MRFEGDISLFWRDEQFLYGETKILEFFSYLPQAEKCIAVRQQWFIDDVYMDHVKRIWYLSPMRAAKVQASLRIRAVSPEPSLLSHISSESRGTFRQKAISLAPLNGWACAVKICHDGMLEDTNSLGGAHIYKPQQNLDMA